MIEKFKLNSKLFTFIFLSFFSLVFVMSCKNASPKNTTSYAEINYELVRFDQLFINADKNSFEELKNSFPYLFPGSYPDSYWLAYKDDSLYQALSERVDHKFIDFSKEKLQIGSVFNNLKANYPAFQSPKVVTLISNLDLNNQVIYADSLMFISLDNYLGSTSDIYQGVPDYVKSYLDSERIPIDVATALVNTMYSSQPNPVFIERMVDAGKQKYATQLLLSGFSEAQIMNYSEEKMQWAIDNEYNIWQYFMEKEYLYNPDKDLIRRFLDPAPFSKFYLESDIESPGQIGVWIGWQIVKSYAENNNQPLPEIMAKPSMEIFNQSKYKPNK